jgi:hypothetical protein
MAKIKPFHLKVAGIAILLIPIAMFSIFAVGETFGGNLSGLSHFLQALPLVLLVFVCWRFPRIGGLATMLLGILLVVAYPLRASNQPLSTTILTELIFFTPPILAGLLIYLSSRTPK